MANVIVFIGNEPPRLLKLSLFKKSVDYLYPDKVVREIPVEMIFATFSDNKSSAVLIAADREVTLREIRAAHLKLIAASGLSKKRLYSRSQG